MPTAGIPVVRLQENNCVRKREKEGLNASEQGARVWLRVEANAERPTKWSMKAHSLLSPAPHPTSRSMVLCRPVAVTGHDPALYTLGDGEITTSCRLLCYSIPTKRVYEKVVVCGMWDGLRLPHRKQTRKSQRKWNPNSQVTNSNRRRRRRHFCSGPKPIAI